MTQTSLAGGGMVMNLALRAQLTSSERDKSEAGQVSVSILDVLDQLTLN